MAIENLGLLASALQQVPSNPEAAIGQLRPLADSGDVEAGAVLAWVLGPQTGRWPEGVAYAKASIDSGNTWLAMQYGQSLVQQPDVSMRAQAIEWIGIAIDDGWSIDPMSLASQLAQQGDLANAQVLVEVALQARPSGARRRWEDFMAATAEQGREVEETATVVRSARDRVLKDIDGDRESIADRRKSVEQLAEQVGNLANKTAGGAIADSYADRAAKVEKTSRNYTWASILLALLIAVGATLTTFVVDGGKLVDDAAAKAAVGVPLVALNLYLGRLAAQYRQEAVALRHIELQFNTANPFLGALDDDRRRDILGLLALRFFPGQGLPGGSGDASNSDVLSSPAAAALLDRLDPRATTGPGTPSG